MRWIISLFGAAGLTVALALVMIQLIAVSDERGGRELVGYVPEPSSNDCIPEIIVHHYAVARYIAFPTPVARFSPNIERLLDATNSAKIRECGWRSNLLGATRSSPYPCPMTVEVESEGLQVWSDAAFCLSEEAQSALGRYLTCMVEGDAQFFSSEHRIEGDVTVFHIIGGPIEPPAPEYFSETHAKSC